MEQEMTPDLLEIARQVQKSRVRTAFERAPTAGYTVSAGFVMDSTREDIDNLTRLRDRLLETAPADTIVQIRDKTNQFHAVTAAELSGIIGELVDFGLGLYARKWELELQINAATTVEDVEAVSW